MPETTFIEGLGQGAASQAAGGIVGAGLGLLLEKHNDKRQLKQQQKLTDMQLAANQKQALLSQKLQMEMWDATNYGAQMKHIKEAGLNPALIYGMSGSGGVTGSANAAGVSGGDAPRGGGEIIAQQGMGLQNALLEAQRKNIEANTEKTKVEAAKAAGVDTELAKTQIASLTQGVENQKAVEALTKVQTDLGNIQKEIQGETTKAQKYIINAEADKILQEINILRNEGIISQNTWEQKIQIVEQQLIGITINNALQQSNIAVNEAQINKWAQELQNATIGLSQSERNTKVNEKLAEFNTSLSREALGALGGIISTVISKKMQFNPKGQKTWESGQDDKGSWSKETYREFVK